MTDIQKQAREYAKKRAGNWDAEQELYDAFIAGARAASHEYGTGYYPEGSN